MLEQKKRRSGAKSRIVKSMIMFLLCMICMVQTVIAAEPIEVSYYYEEVCASCDGTKDFYELYNRVFSSEDKQTFEAKISTYNVFMDSCRTQYEDVKKDIQIPSGVSLPVLIVDGTWISGHDNMEAQMRDLLMNQGIATELKPESSEIQQSGTEDESRFGNQVFWSGLFASIEDAKRPVVVLFSTNNCEDCHFVKTWFSEHEMSVQLIEYNIIEDECLNELKTVFTQYGVPEEKQKVPAVFFGNQYLIGKDEIPSIEQVMEKGNTKNTELLNMMKEADVRGSENKADNMSLWTLAAAGLLAGFNPCSISMLLMLMSLLLSEKASVWKNGLLYLAGKYAAYISIGLVIFMTASQISGQTMERVGSVMNLAMGILFIIASALYIVDAIRVFRQDYGKIRMQLPVGLRRMNHKLIKKFSSAKGMMQPLMILMLGVVISFGEFFCTGQIYMASITYLLKDQVKAVIFPFLVYTTAMSVPAVIMIMLIQRTRNTEAVSDFMFRHLGAIKIFNAVLFALFAVYFFVF
ncbi:MAG: hypothetical protein IKU20_02705 [Lachnospiraceae bacterium]|nr:hypothetical protein [Lachnospiraceae bacterium]